MPIFSYKSLPGTSKIYYWYIAVILIWPAFSRAFWIDSYGRVPFIFTIILGIYLLTTKKEFTKGPSLVWLIWLSYTMINLFIQGTTMDKPFVNCTLLFACPIVLYITSEEFIRDRNNFLSFVTIVLLIYLLLGLDPTKFVSVGENSINDHGVSSLGNILPISMVFFCFVLCLRHYYKTISLPIMIVLLLATFIVIFISGTRKAFGASIIVIVMMLLPEILKFNKKSFINLFSLIAFYYGVDYYMHNSLMAARFELVTKEEEIYGTNWFLKLVGDRAYFYVVGMDVFFDHWLTGVGLQNFINKGFGYIRLHTEYMVQLVEGGVLGTSIFIFFHLKFIKPLIKLICNYETRYDSLVISGAYLAVLFIGLTAWTYEFPIYFLGLGIVHGYIISSEL